MTSVNLETLKKNGVTDLFLNFYAFEAHGESKVKSWIKKAKAQKINVHIWVQSFYDGEWHNPKTMNLTSKLKEIKGYANIEGVKGIHLDYLRYPGNAYKTDGGADAITNFVKKVRSQNPKVFLSCAVMPENDCKKYYGQDISALGKIVDTIIPMQYKGNYKAGTEWLKSTIKLFSGKATIWSGLQTYKSDDDPTKLSASELLSDAKTCISNGAKGVILFRYGLCPTINFTSLQDKKTVALSSDNIKTMAVTVKKYVDEHKKLPSSVTVNGKKYTWPQVWYVLSYAVNNLGKSLTSVPNVKSSIKANGNVINEKVYPSDFKDQSKRVVQYIKQNGQVPNYVRTVKSKKRVRPRVSIDALARILVYYYSHKNTLPDYCNYNSSRFSSAKSKYGHATKSGCDNMGQNNGVYCGPHSMQECIRNLTGKVISQSTLASWAGTGSGGTDHQGLETAIAKAAKQLNVKLTCKWYSFSELGWDGIKKILASQNQDCVIHNLYRYKPGVYGGDGHYEVVNAVNDSNINVQNSLGNRSCNDCYCGYIEYRSKSDFETYISGISQKSVLVITRG
ncbi:putative glycoside hydrolase [uncultured Methanobrevibacter sp.]|uniref:putative glycoside hydrolase n=1 Tax=uncultured Methanobrevibacter sp. TaxID=253161 RepID=UPI0025ED47DF|nr:putative glycoside hydrolase [uncultured Methanobrevibacter sp.]